ncbi:helix-turn-helix domain-containing protein [Flavilitoribacter nigricans]|uniref:HTH araC/xylS-type domain-containing protein n=1 Tax=Flavilitoribacter nigricans (strain ATCC 23147 / DSM 23189 / NBRC 102662 / NCIMB 1420 / SS-2) TaxID=1122177 RepID=A0A2D0N1H3_FLAN2|nr:AraC family transcriptional regulator [Flavilitoribacter nigricans]PHN02345.1 hypothetical protein CRP01_32390 [Flavilitoribacter nigricans DSM 23189 = NBRC 102662]
MRTIQFPLLTPEKWYELLHRQLPSTIRENQFIFDRELGKGKLQYTFLQEGLWVNQMNFELHDPIKLLRVAREKNDCFAINFYLSNSAIDYEDGRNSFKLGIENLSILLNSATGDIEFIIPANTPVRIFNLGFTREWLKSTLLNAENVDKLGKLFLSDDPIYIVENLDFKFKNILNDLDLNTVSRLRLFSGILQLLDYLVIKLNSRVSESLHTANIHYADLEQLMKAKNQLDTHLEESIPVEELAQGAGMSLSKFKRLFKQVFGTTPYKYYLQNRMEKAMEMLLSGRQSVSEVGFLIGYTNLSQFTKAFKKHHGILPSEVE